MSLALAEVLKRPDHPDTDPDTDPAADLATFGAAPCEEQPVGNLDPRDTNPDTAAELGDTNPGDETGDD